MATSASTSDIEATLALSIALIATSAPGGGPLYRIRTVIHVMTSGTGPSATGYISPACAASGIALLNADFRAHHGTRSGLAGSSDTNIEFVLATTDRYGAATSGVEYYNNNTWLTMHKTAAERHYGGKAPSIIVVIPVGSDHYAHHECRVGKEEDAPEAKIKERILKCSAEGEERWISFRDRPPLHEMHDEL